MLMLWERKGLKLKVTSPLGGRSRMRRAWKGCIIEGGMK
jgi:hypothetical protein